MAKTSPYEGLPDTAFWKTAVAETDPLVPGALYTPKFKIGPQTRIATAGSCFAQEVGRALKGAGLKVLDYEPFVPGMSDGLARRFGYRQFSARYGNIYTMRHLWQLLAEARGLFKPSYPVWEKGGRFHDAMRPGVEPEGLKSKEDVQRHRADHLARVLKLIKAMDVLIFTCGLAEAWICKADGTVYPTAPGTVAGHHEPKLFALKTFTHAEILLDFQKVRKFIRSVNPEVKFILTTSPVPMTATASGQHVEVANSYAKSTLRSVCGDLQMRYGDVDYFPGYEIVTAQKARGMHYGRNLRNVSRAGVDTAMGQFFAAHGLPPAPVAPPAPAKADPACEDALLEAFAR